MKITSVWLGALLFLFPLAETAFASNTLPKALITTPGELSRFKPGVVVPFNGSESYDPDGGAITFYKWYVNGVLESSGGSPSYSTFHRSFTLASGERYRSVTITLEVRDDELSWSSVSRTFTITEVTTYYYITDHVGSIRSIVDDGGFEVSHEDFDPFGAPLPGRSQDSGIAYHQNKFTGHERDSEGGLDIDYMQSRTYDPDLGRFLSVDPLAADAPGWSPYRAFFNNPLRFIDPEGLFEIETGKIEKGDNLTAITKQLNEKFKTNLTVDQIAKANDIKDVNKIKAGEFIKLPGTDIELNFDLTSLKVSDVNYGVDIPGLEWGGTSGREGYQSSEFQNLKDKGPIPEGEYKVDPSRTQSISDISTWVRAKGTVGRGSWPGLEKSWGEHRTWLTPSTGTNTFGRSGFTIHGGAVPGSAGCIDLTGGNNSFHSWLKSHGKPLNLNVKY